MVRRRHAGERARSTIDVLNFSHYLYNTATLSIAVYDRFNRAVIFVICPEADTRIVICMYVERREIAGLSGDTLSFQSRDFSAQLYINGDINKCMYVHAARYRTAISSRIYIYNENYVIIYL